MARKPLAHVVHAPVDHQPAIVLAGVLADLLEREERQRARLAVRIGCEKRRQRARGALAAAARDRHLRLEEDERTRHSERHAHRPRNGHWVAARRPLGRIGGMWGGWILALECENAEDDTHQPAEHAEDAREDVVPSELCAPVRARLEQPRVGEENERRRALQPKGHEHEQTEPAVHRLEVRALGVELIAPAAVVVELLQKTEDGEHERGRLEGPVECLGHALRQPQKVAHADEGDGAEGGEQPKGDGHIQHVVEEGALAWRPVGRARIWHPRLVPTEAVGRVVVVRARHIPLRRDRLERLEHEGHEHRRQRWHHDDGEHL
mmetsp:Transcript_29147/g.68215  ORF Transcript_29147/g.68215 Transcript_29147/m.68215 type:complete len:321 (-) Transcript_29147:615-1577(-)